jgi:hypothetical protein
MNDIPEPKNDRERTIAETIDRKLLTSDSPYESILAEIVMSVPFDMTISETEFLFNYAHWRLAHPLKKQPSRGILPEDLKRSG